MVCLFVITDSSYYDAMSAIQTVTMDNVVQKLEDHLTLKQVAKRLKPHHLLIYATGANTVPCSGWNLKPKIEFKHGLQSSFMSASTCSLKFVLPITESNKDLQGFMFALCVTLSHMGTFSDV